MSGCSQGDIIYLDNNATTPLLPEVKEAIRAALECFGNPSSLHSPGRQCRALYEQARGDVARMVGATPEEIIFTSGGTEANNLAILGYCLQFKKGHIITSLIEHPSVMNPVLKLQKMGYSVSFVRPSSSGVIDPEDVLKKIRGDTILVSIMHANNETGALQPIRQVSEFLKDREIVLHTDAAQSIGKTPVDVHALGVDLMTIVPHKFHGPKGIGALYVKKGTKLRPILHGASQEGGLRPGTENLILAAGFGQAAKMVYKEIDRREAYLGRITDLLYKELKDHIPELVLNTGNGPRLPNTLNLSIKGVNGHALVEALKDRVAFSTGSACHEGRTTASEVLLAMGLPAAQAVSRVGLSTGLLNSPEEMSLAAELIAEAVRRLR